MAGLSVATLFYFFWSETVAYIAGGIATLILLSALASPVGLYATIDRGFLALGSFIGRGARWVVMPAVLYLFFTPFSLLFRRGRRDSMTRFYEANAETYWSDFDPTRGGSGHRERQY